MENTTQTDVIDLGNLEPISIKIKYRNKDYLLCEADADAAVKYRNAVMKATKIDSNGKLTGFDGLADVEPLLVSLCLKEVVGTNQDGSPKLQQVTIAQVRRFAPSALKFLHQKAKEISDLEEGSQDTLDSLEEKILTLQNRRQDLLDGVSESKNGHSATMDSSN